MKQAYYKGLKVTEVVKYGEGELQGTVMVKLDNSNFPVVVKESLIVIE